MMTTLGLHLGWFPLPALDLWNLCLFLMSYRPPRNSPWSLSWFPGAPWKPKPWAYNQLVISRNSCLESIGRTGFHVLTAGSSHRKHLWKGSKSLLVPPMEAQFSCLPYDTVISFRPRCWIHSFKSAEWNMISMQAFHSLLRTQRLIRHMLCY